MSKKEVGQLGEELALNYLKALGFKILTTNYHCPLGEIDIVARDNNFLCFVEVKTRLNRKFGLPEEFINQRKLKRMAKCIDFFLVDNNNPNLTPRIDVLAVELNNGSVKRIELIKNAQLSL